MRKLYALAIVLLLAAPQTSQAIGSFSLFTSDVLNATSGLTSQSSVAKSSGMVLGTATIGSVSLAMELEELGTNMQSPHHNVIDMSAGSTQVAGATGMGLSALQQSVGAGNVSLSLNSIVAGGAAGGTSLGSGALGIIGSTNGVGPELAFTLMMINNPAFAVLNSFPVAQMLLVKQAITSVASAPSGALASGAIALDLINVGVSEFSPHHNVALAGSMNQTATVTTGLLLSAVQQNAGVGNVQAAVNQISVGTGNIAGTAVTASP